MLWTWLTIGCTGPDPIETAHTEVAPDPGQLGPHPVGVRTIEVPFGSDALTVELWYPAAEEARGAPGFAYRIEDLLTPEALAASPEMSDLDVTLPTNAVRDATPEEGSFPAVLFSHGASGLRMQSTYLTVHLASHGYIVASPDHPGSTLSDTIVAGTLDIGGLFASLATRTDELAAVRDALPGAMDGINIDHIGVVGHSFGALTAMRWLLDGQPADVIVAQAVPPYDLASLGAVVPLEQSTAHIQIQVGGIDRTTPPNNADTYDAHISGTYGRFALAHGGHFTFSDMCLLDTEIIAAASIAGIGDALADGCALDNTDPDIAIPAIRHFATAQLNAVLHDSEAALDWLSQENAERLAPGEATYEE